LAVVTITINGRLYDIACEDDQSARVQALGREIDTRAQSLLSSVGVVSDSRLLVMLCLLLADELSDARDNVSGLDRVAAATDDGDARLAAIVEQLAGRIEAIATRLERA
jgi:cell division protein ZapA